MTPDDSPQLPPLPDRFAATDHGPVWHVRCVACRRLWGVAKSTLIDAAGAGRLGYLERHARMCNGTTNHNTPGATSDG